MTDVVTFGETMGALRGPGPLRLGGTMELSIAGAESNVAIGLARLGHDVAWVGRVGADETGSLVRRTLRAEGVDISAVSDDPARPTGLVLFEHRIRELIRVTYYRSGSAGSQLSPDDVLPLIRPGVRVVHITGVTAALGQSAQQCAIQAALRAREVGCLVSVDVNYRSRLWSLTDARTVLRPLVAHADIVFASEDELNAIAPGADPAWLLAQGIGQVVIKRGAAGATVYAADAEVNTPAKTVPVTAVVGAGDAFVAGYLSSCLDGEGLPDRLQRGVTTAAFAVAHRGDWEGLPNRDELALLDFDDGTTIR